MDHNAPVPLAMFFVVIVTVIVKDTNKYGSAPTSCVIHPPSRLLPQGAVIVVSMPPLSLPSSQLPYKALRKLIKVLIVGIKNADGAHKQFKKLTKIVGFL
jgi:hypothetical protein